MHVDYPSKFRTPHESCDDGDLVMLSDGGGETPLWMFLLPHALLQVALLLVWAIS